MGKNSEQQFALVKITTIFTNPWNFRLLYHIALT